MSREDFDLMKNVLLKKGRGEAGGQGVRRAGTKKRQEMRRKENEANGRFAQNSQGVPIRFRLVPTNGNGGTILTGMQLK